MDPIAEIDRGTDKYDNKTLFTSCGTTLEKSNMYCELKCNDEQ